MIKAKTSKPTKRKLSIIFLDIDGVLNKGLVYSNSPQEDVIINKHYGWMNRSLIENFNELISETNAHIVVSSSWRYDTLNKNQRMLSAFNINGKVIGQTPELSHESCRGDEIKAWLKSNEKLIGKTYTQFTDYIILDDCECVLTEQLPFFLKTDPYVGFSKEKQLVAMRYLKNSNLKSNY
jgi:hypothetical protein